MIAIPLYESHRLAKRSDITVSHHDKMSIRRWLTCGQDIDKPKGYINNSGKCTIGMTYVASNSLR